MSSMQINFADEAYQLNIGHDYAVGITAMSQDAAQHYWTTDHTPSSFVLHSNVPWPANTGEVGIPNILFRFNLSRCFSVTAS